MTISRHLLHHAKRATQLPSWPGSTRNFHRYVVTWNHQQPNVESKRSKTLQLRDSTYRFPTVLDGLQNEFLSDTFFQPFARGLFAESPFSRIAAASNARNASRPVLMDLKEMPDRYEIVAEVPGIPKDKIKLDFDNKNNVLSLSGEKSFVREGRIPKEPKDEKTKDEKGVKAKDEEDKYLSRERRFGSFSRSVQLSEDVKPEEISASLENGVLTVKIPKLKPEEREKEKFKINID